MSPNEFDEVPQSHITECKIPVGTLTTLALYAITIGWNQFQSAINKPLKLCLICMNGLLLLVAIWQENQQQALC